MEELIQKINDAIQELGKMGVDIRDNDDMDWKLKEIKFSADEGCCVFYCEEIKLVL